MRWEEKFNEEFVGDDPRHPIFIESPKVLDFIKTDIIEPLISKAEKIIGIHESPHSLKNCRLCQIEELRTNWLNGEQKTPTTTE